MKAKKQSLADISTKVPFKVPENYFSEFNDSIMDKLPKKEIPVIKEVSLWDKTKPWLYMAAMFFGLFFTIKVLTTNTKTRTSEKNIASTSISQQNYWSDVEISEEDFFDYIETQFADENYYDLIYNQGYLNSL